MTKAAYSTAIFIAATLLAGCEPTQELLTQPTPQEILRKTYGDAVVLESISTQNGISCGYASLPDVTPPFAFRIEGKTLKLFSSAPDAFLDCPPSFVAPRVVEAIS